MEVQNGDVYATIVYIETGSKVIEYNCSRKLVWPTIALATSHLNYPPVSFRGFMPSLVKIT